MTPLCRAGSSSGSGGLSGGAIAGVVVGVLITLAALALFLVWRRWHRLRVRRPTAVKRNEIMQAMLPGGDANVIVSARPTIPDMIACPLLLIGRVIRSS